MAREMEFRIVDVDKLTPNPFQPREQFSKESLRELADSLKSRGEIQPIIVRQHKEGYQIIAGERRWRAAKIAGLRQIPVLVKDTTEEDVLLESLIENLHREDLSPIEKERAVDELWKSGRWKTSAELGRALGKSNWWVEDRLRAKKIREADMHAYPTVATRTIIDVAGVEKEDREIILEKVEKGEIKTPEVREYARVVKKAPKSVKRAILKPKARITLRIAEKVLELPEEKQIGALKQIETLRLEEDEAVSHIEAMKVEVPLPPPEELEKVRVRYQELQKDIKAKLETPEAIERGELFRNWTSHIAVVGILDSISCPVCKSKELGWICHSLTIEDALQDAERKYKQDINKRKTRK